MENKSSMPMTPFDEMITSPELQIMKALIPYMSGSAQKTTAACCKFLELRRTFHLFQGRRNGIHAQMFHDEDGAFSSFPDISTMLSTIYFSSVSSFSIFLILPSKGTSISSSSFNFA